MRKIQITSSVFFLAALLAIGIYIITCGNKSFSENENRRLTQKPDFSISDILKGNLQSEFDKFLNDQVPARNFLMKTASELKLLSGRKDIGGAYIGKDGYYFLKVTDNDIDLKRFKNNVTRVEELAKKHKDIPCTLMLCPSADVILADKLPFGAEHYNANALYEVAKTLTKDCVLLNPSNLLLEHNSEYIYYRTDHHWTSYGAYLGYKSYTKINNYGEYNATIGTTEFLGSIYSKILDPNATPDSIELPEIGKNLKITVNSETSDFYHMECLEEKDKYQVFLGGNPGYVEITGGTGTGTLLVIKDSYANSLVPYLSADYDKIIMIDLRFYAGAISGVFANNKIDDILCIYELNNFAEDSNLAKLVM